MRNGAPSPIRWVAGAFVLGDSVSETRRVQSLASVCTTWLQPMPGGADTRCELASSGNDLVEFLPGADPDRLPMSLAED